MYEKEVQCAWDLSRRICVMKCEKTGGIKMYGREGMYFKLMVLAQILVRLVIHFNN